MSKMLPLGIHVEGQKIHSITGKTSFDAVSFSFQVLWECFYEDK